MVVKKFLFVLKEILQGKSILRSYLDFSLLNIELRGRTIDVGGGSGEGYVSFVKRAEGTVFETFDIKNGNFVDFEKDQLPAADNTYDTVLFLNVMEHIFNHQHIANEVVRITKPGGQLVGYVPFLIWYHPDHKDFFRYTHEALQIILERTGATQIEIIPDYAGPFIAATQMALLSIPRLLRPFLFIPAYILDEAFFFLKKTKESRFILGYLFLVHKSS